MRRLLLCVFLTAAIALDAQSPAPPTTKADIDRWMTDLSNWGRLGRDDERGSVNLITPARRKAAAALVTEGVSVSLARDTDFETAVDNPNPFTHTMSDPVGGAFKSMPKAHRL